MNNLSYETAVKLRDAGFPESRDSELIGRSVTIDDWTSPHLSELLDACGEDFLSLELKSFGWVAFSTPDEQGILERHKGEGSTPEEAVAALCLALHNK